MLMLFLGMNNTGKSRTAVTIMDPQGTRIHPYPGATLELLSLSQNWVTINSEAIPRNRG